MKRPDGSGTGSERIDTGTPGDPAAPSIRIGSAFRLVLGALADFWRRGGLTLAASLLFGAALVHRLQLFRTAANSP